MKTTLTIFTVLAVLYNVGFAQDEDVLRPRGGGRQGGRSSNSSSGSTPIMLGIEGGINYNMFSQTLTGLVPDSRLGVFESGSGISPFFGAFIDIGVSHNLGIQVKLAYDQKKFDNSKGGLIDCPEVGTAKIDSARVTSEYINTISYIDFTPQLRWNVTPEFFILVGPTIHFQIGNGSQTNSLTISSEDSCYFNYGLPNQTKKLEFSSDSIGTNKTRVGAQIDIGYKFSLSPSVFLVPKVGFQYMFTKLASDEAGVDDSKQYTTGIVPITATDKMLHSLQFSLGLWFQL